MIKDVTPGSIAESVRGSALPGVGIHTDEFSSYFWHDSSEFAHKSVNHTQTYVDGNVHVNGVENV